MSEELNLGADWEQSKKLVIYWHKKWAKETKDLKIEIADWGDDAFAVRKELQKAQAHIQLQGEAREECQREYNKVATERDALRTEVDRRIGVFEANKKLVVERDALKESLKLAWLAMEDAANCLWSAYDWSVHCLENECVPTKDEVFQNGCGMERAREARDKLLAENAWLSESGE